MNGKIEKFEDLGVWKESISLATEIYTILKNGKDFSLKDQMQRAVVSIASDIAEGFERNSNKEFIQFLYFAKASCGELRTQLFIVSKINILKNDEVENLIEKQERYQQCCTNLSKPEKKNSDKIKKPVYGLLSPDSVCRFKE